MVSCLSHGSFTLTLDLRPIDAIEVGKPLETAGLKTFCAAIISPDVEPEVLVSTGGSADLTLGLPGNTIEFSAAEAGEFDFGEDL